MTKKFFIILLLINLSLFPKEVKKDLPFDTFHKGVRESFRTQKEVYIGSNAKYNFMYLLLNYGRDDLLKLSIKEYNENSELRNVLNTYFFKPSFSKKKKLKSWKCLYKNPDGESSLVYKKLFLSGMPREIRYLDKDKKLSNNKYGFAKEIYKLDRNGNEILREYQNEKGELVEQEGIARITSEYDENGNRILEKLFGKDGNLKQDANGISQRVWKYDSNGYLELAAEYNNKNEPLSKVIVTKRKYDNANRVTEESYFLEDIPTLNADGIHKIKWAYDEKGNAIEEAYFNQENKESPARGIIKYKWFYDDKNNRIKEEAVKFNQEKEIYNYEPVKEEEKQETKLTLHLQIPSKEERMKLANKVIENTVTKDSKEFRVRSTYDDKGNLIQKEFLNEKGELVSYFDTSNIVKIRWKHDKNGFPISEKYFDKESKPFKMLYAGIEAKMKFDKNGNLKFYESYDEKGGSYFGKFIFNYDNKCIDFLKEKYGAFFGDFVQNCLIGELNDNYPGDYKISRFLIKSLSQESIFPFETNVYIESRTYSYRIQEKEYTSFYYIRHRAYIRYPQFDKIIYVEFDKNLEPIYVGLEDRMPKFFLNPKYNLIRLYYGD